MKKTKQQLPTSSENFLYPGTKTLKNKYGEKNKKHFETLCARDSEIALFDIRQEPLPDIFDSDYLVQLHYRLFNKTFEWAGITRNVPFTFADGTTAAMPRVIKKANDCSFANGSEINQGLKDLDQSLADWNYLRGLSREEFVNTAAQMFNHLNHIHPFREGNGRTQRLFFENLAKSVGYSLDFSLVTTERMNVASEMGRRYGDPRLLQWMFNDISDPQKTILLKEFMSHMQDTGKSLKKDLVVVAEAGETYTGVYESVLQNSFIMKVDGTYVVGSKDHLSPEQLKTFKPGDEISFTAPTVHDTTLIPREQIVPLTKKEIAAGVANSTDVQEARRNVESLLRIVYSNPNALESKFGIINENPQYGEWFANQIAHSPKSMGSLVGRKFLCFKNAARVNAEEHVDDLRYAVEKYVDAVRNVRNNILTEHKTEQLRCGQRIEMPSQDLQNSLNLPRKAQQEVLEASPQLQAELRNLLKKVNERLSVGEQKAISEKRYSDLAKSLGTSVCKAETIVGCLNKAEKAKHELDCSGLYARVAKRPPQQEKVPKAMAFAS
ncbi:BID domain-containing T4SS effector [Bartonella sp. CB189]|uniref:BID domain-containing T4SS effector n=1 Tax=Bartonella sp. CB189 TaxID=3112254 RepID=UPI002F96E34B